MKSLSGAQTHRPLAVREDEQRGYYFHVSVLVSVL